MDDEKIVFTDEITNEGESVLFVGAPGAKDSNGNYWTKPVQITLTIKEKSTDNVLATTELTLTRDKGLYIVKK